MRRKKLSEPSQLYPPMDSGLLETDPKHTGEEPGGALDATRSGIQGEWAVPDVLTGNAQGPACQFIRGDARKKSTSRLREALLMLLSPQRDANLEEFHPVLRCVCPKLEVN